MLTAEISTAYIARILTVQLGLLSDQIDNQKFYYTIEIQTFVLGICANLVERMQQIIHESIRYTKTSQLQMDDNWMLGSHLLYLQNFELTDFQVRQYLIDVGINYNQMHFFSQIYQSHLQQKIFYNTYYDLRLVHRYDHQYYRL